jgi:hypothetical protein
VDNHPNTDFPAKLLTTKEVKKVNEKEFERRGGWVWDG